MIIDVPIPSPFFSVKQTAIAEEQRRARDVMLRKLALGVQSSEAHASIMANKMMSALKVRHLG